MPGGRTAKARSVANPVTDAVLTSLNERLLRECHSLYTDTRNGLMKIASGLGVRLLPPRKKIIVMIMGNHSAGKSSFINWYIEEHIQKTGVAIETQGFTFITSGRKRESLTGNATLHLYPHFRQLMDFQGVSEYLNAEISTSKEKKFSLVTFIDTPGLVDGDMKYPYDVNSALVWLGEQADLIFVFFDPMGQALCKRTLDIVERLNEKCGDKLRFFLSKADEAGRETDRQRVMMQIVQELCRRPGLNKCGFEMPTIHIPGPQKPSRCINQIDEVCRTVEKAINQTVQNLLNQLEKDSDLITSTINSKFKQHSDSVNCNRTTYLKVLVFGGLGLLLPALCVLSLILSTLSKEILEKILGENMGNALHTCAQLIMNMWEWIPEDTQAYVLLFLAGTCYLFLLLAKYFARTQPTLRKKEIAYLKECRSYIQDVVIQKKKQLYEEYLHQCTTEQDQSWTF
ncbi:uncharacterized protein SI:DKEY-98F17.5 isoform X1 [Latimeria chalumnae]|uniref:Si:dkey-98f17.5 n=1 Tax=Latimeria chalumnae TaxID=7897 RepID=H3BD55_LATCH|nr:PREDICTED: uncharacterized protein LOC102353772 isoform X2 [Latimeria chalumnae]|eukprot:XP_005990328.1 PREDICTED: uncharacterized protein LOC102353772 isoform X2 [Latimeria chalumnae]